MPPYAYGGLRTTHGQPLTYMGSRDQTQLSGLHSKPSDLQSHPTGSNMQVWFRFIKPHLNFLTVTVTYMKHNFDHVTQLPKVFQW